MLQVFFGGIVGKNSELFHTQDNKPVLNFSCSCTVYDGEQKTEWLQCSLWGNRAESLVDYVLKGSHISGVGRLTKGGYENKDGEWVETLNVTVTELHLGGSSNTSAYDKKPEPEAKNRHSRQRPEPPARQQPNNNARRQYKGK